MSEVPEIVMKVLAELLGTAVTLPVKVPGTMTSLLMEVPGNVVVILMKVSEDVVARLKVMASCLQSVLMNPNLVEEASWGLVSAVTAVTKVPGGGLAVLKALKVVFEGLVAA